MNLCSNCEGSRYLPFIVDTLDWNCFWTFQVKCIFPEWNIREWSLVQVKHKLYWDITIRNKLWNCTFKRKFSSSRNLGQGSTFPAVPFLFTQLVPFKMFQAQPSVSSRLPPNSLKMFGSLALKTPVPIATTIFWKITVPARCDLMITPLIFFLTFHRLQDLVFLFFQWSEDRFSCIFLSIH